MSFRVTALIFGLSLAAGCKPSVGSSCDKGEARCIDAAGELVCQAGRFVESPCRGRRGCGLTPQGTTCDFSANQAGDVCSTDDEGTATCSNQTDMIVCHGGSYSIVPCRGSKGCLNVEGRALCDTSKATLGDACRDEGLKACSDDGSQVLVCQQHVMAQYFPCRGPDGCSSAAGKLKCDTSIAQLGDACDQRLDGRSFSCTPDRTSMLTCKGGVFSLDEACKSRQKCFTNGATTRCDTAPK